MTDSKSKHLPYLNLFKNPGEAFRTLAENPPIREAMGLYAVAATALSFLILADFITPPQKHSLAILVRSLWQHTHVSLAVARFYPALLIPVLLAIATFGGFIYYVAAGFLGAEISFSSFWTALMFIESVFMIPCYWAEPILWLRSLLWFWRSVLIVWMMKVLCGFSVRRAVTAFFAPVVVIGGLALIIGTFILILAVGKARLLGGSSLPAPSLTPINMPADYAWTAQSLDGSTFKMDSLRGKVVVLNFWATWCGPCKMEMPSLQRLHDQVKGQNIEVLAISEEKLDVVQRFLKTQTYTFPIMVRSERMPLFTSNAIPVTFVISPEGQIIGRELGAARWDAPQFISYLQSLKTKTALPGANAPLNLGMGGRDTALILNSQAVKLVYHRHFAEAQRYYDQALAALGPDPKPEDTDVMAMLIGNEGYLAYKAGQYERADDLMKKALRIHRSLPHPNEKGIAAELLNLRNLHFDMNRRNAAKTKSSN